jgi:beta-glucosidase
MSDRAQFPDGFLWGAATASYQIEGAAREDGRGESIWDRFSHTPGKVANGDTGDVAADHYHRWQEDIGIMRRLGLHAYRFSVAWPRILPDGHGKVNAAGLDFYDRLVDGLLDAGIEPWVTLYHWDLPQALDERGGWANRDTVEAFAEYTDALTRRIGDRARHWITINEPWCVAHLGHNFGIHAPGRTDLKEALQVSHSLNLAHGRAVEIVRHNVPGAEVGITLNPAFIYPASDSEADAEAVRRADGFGNRWFFDPVLRGEYPEDMVRAFGDTAPEIQAGDMEIISVPTDFLGINNYNPQFVKADPSRPDGVGNVDPGGEHTAMGWPVYPQGLEDLILRIQRDYDPPAIYVTENGAAYDDPPPADGRVHDPRRVSYLQRHLLACHRAIEQGAKLRGYFVWSLLDNFEWAEGYAKRFGVTHVDFETQERTIKDSGLFFADVIEANGVPHEQ